VSVFSPAKPNLGGQDEVKSAILIFHPGGDKANRLNFEGSFSDKIRLNSGLSVTLLTIYMTTKSYKNECHVIVTEEKS
jgi:hypothetical protein